MPLPPSPASTNKAAAAHTSHNGIFNADEGGSSAPGAAADRTFLFSMIDSHWSSSAAAFVARFAVAAASRRVDNEHIAGLHVGCSHVRRCVFAALAPDHVVA